VTPNLPGLIHDINPAINVGNISFLFNISWLFGVSVYILSFSDLMPRAKHSLLPQFFVAGSVYYVLSAAFPPRETFIGKTVHGDEAENETIVVEENLSGKESRD
jgi:hypothetical protein